jgi:YHS domain-containing protein
MKNRRLALILIVLIVLSVFAFGQTRPRPQKATDPVCGLMVEKDPELSTVYQGRTYYFCSKKDRDTFSRNPVKYVRWLH